MSNVSGSPPPPWAPGPLFPSFKKDLPRNPHMLNLSPSSIIPRGKETSQGVRYVCSCIMYLVVIALLGESPSLSIGGHLKVVAFVSQNYMKQKHP